MPEDLEQNYERMSSEQNRLPNHLSFDYHNSLTPNSESAHATSIATSIAQPKLEPTGNAILANSDSFSSLSDATPAAAAASLNATNLNLYLHVFAQTFTLKP